MDEINLTEQDLKNQLKLQDLESFCESIFPLDEGTELCSIGGTWGEFTSSWMTWTRD